MEVENELYHLTFLFNLENQEYKIQLILISNLNGNSVFPMRLSVPWR